METQPYDGDAMLAFVRDANQKASTWENKSTSSLSLESCSTTASEGQDLASLHETNREKPLENRPQLVNEVSCEGLGQDQHPGEPLIEKPAADGSATGADPVPGGTSTFSVLDFKARLEVWIEEL